MKLTNNLYLYPERGMLDCNTYVLIGDPGVIIDPGNAEFLPERLDAMRQDGIDTAGIGVIANTHLHVDHCGANQAFKEVSRAEIYLHPVQKSLYDFVVIEGARTFGIEPVDFTEDALFDGDKLLIAGAMWEMILSPGHSPDCVCYYNRAEQILICGDVVFDTNTGRVDLPGGNADELKKTIENLATLEIEFLLPGHMDIVTGAERVKTNFEFIKGNIFPWL